tara:strand:+ start:60 stop:443 length:384 start_codon:yes stop_codon:yes gene_type:complete
MKNRDYLLLDGDCGLCHRLANFIDKRLSKNKRIYYRPISSTEAQEMIASMPEHQRNADSVYLIKDGKSYIKSAAGIRCLLYMRWYYSMWFPIVWLIPLPIRDFGYVIIARYRHKFFKKPKQCMFRLD